MPSSSSVEALDEPPNQLRTLPCAKWRSTSRGCSATLAHELEHFMRLLPARLGPDGARLARVHQGVMFGREKAVVHEEIFFDAEFRVAPLEVTRTVVFYAMAK